MRFGSLPIGKCVGAIMAHGVRVDALVLKKGERLAANDVDGLRRAGLATIVAAKLDKGDVDESEAARRLAAHVAGPGLRVDRSFTGYAHLFAAGDGLLGVKAAVVDRLNGSTSE